MTTLSADNFLRTDQVGLGTASDGETWVRDAGVGVSNIVSNEGRIGPGGNDSQFLLGTTSASTINISCQVRSGDAGNVVAVLFRYSSTGGASQNGYRAGIFGSNLVLDKYVSGVRSNVSNINVGYVVGENWRVRAVAVGTNIKVSAWKIGNTEPGSPQINVTDSSTATGQYGISVFMSNDFTYFSDLIVTDNQSSATQVTKSLGVRALVRTQQVKSLALRALIRTQRALSAPIRALVRTQRALTAPIRAIIRTQATKSTTLRAIIRTQRAITTPLRATVRTLSTRSATIRARVRTRVALSIGIRALVSSNNQRALSVGIRAVVASPALNSLPITWTMWDGRITWEIWDGNITWRDLP